MPVHLTAGWSPPLCGCSEAWGQRDSRGRVFVVCVETWSKDGQGPGISSHLLYESGPNSLQMCPLPYPGQSPDLALVGTVCLLLLGDRPGGAPG